MSTYRAPYPHELPQFNTATDVIDHLTDQVADLVVISNFEAGVMLTESQFQVLFARTFDAALPVFLDALDRQRPEVGKRLRRQFVAEYEANEL